MGDPVDGMLPEWIVDPAMAEWRSRQWQPMGVKRSNLLVIFAGR
jgi:hypothetical protein